MLRMFLALVAASALAACAALQGEDAVVEAPPAYNLTIGGVTGVSSAAAAPPELAAALTAAIQTAVQASPRGGPPADLTFVISDYRRTGKGQRAGHQATVDLVVKSPNGRTLRDFTITRTATTLGADPAKARKDSLVSRTAEAVAATLRGEK